MNFAENSDPKGRRAFLPEGDLDEVRVLPGMCDGLSAFAWGGTVSYRRLLTSAFAMVIVAMFANPVTGQSSELGEPFSRFFTATDYGAHSQNWGLAEGPDGIVYVANNHGLLEYDGARWRLHASPGGIVSSVLYGSDGRIYIGADGEFGYYTADSNGSLTYSSLSRDLPPERAPFSRVRNIVETSAGVFFQAREIIARSSNGGPLYTWQPSSGTQGIFAVGDAVYVALPGEGLTQISGNEFVPVPGLASTGSLLAGTIQAVVRFGADGLLVGTADDGLFRVDGQTVTPFVTAIDENLSDEMLYTAISLQDGSLALGTLRGGLYRIDNNGELLSHSELRDGSVYAVRAAHSGGLWTTLSNGIAYLAQPGPATFFGPKQGLRGLVAAITRHDGRIHAGTTVGAFVLQSDGESPLFTELSKIPSWDLLSTEMGLVAATNSGVLVFDRRAPEALLQESTARFLLRSLRDERRFYVGLNDGLAAISFTDDGRWVSHRIPGISEQILTIVEMPDGTLWLGTAFEGTIRVRGHEDRSADIAIDRFGPEHGLPDTVDDYVHPFLTDRELVFGTASGPYRFVDESGGRFEPVEFPSKDYIDTSRSLFRLAQDASGNLWLRGDLTGVAWRDAGEAYTWAADALRPIPQQTVHDFHFDQDGVAWLAGIGVWRFDSGQRPQSSPEFRALVRGVGSPQIATPIFGGITDSVEDEPILAPDLNDLRFEYAAPQILNPGPMQYRVQLRGLDKDWSTWTTETYKDYTNLPAGDYSFRVQAMDSYGRTSREGRYEFDLLPPWYQSAWAYLAYTIVLFATLLFVISVAVRWRSARVRQHNLELQIQVTERTAELHARNLQIERQAHQLAELDSVKARFFANISHDLRTPLTLILGPLKDLRKSHLGDMDPTTRQRLDLAIHNSNHLQALVGQLFDLAKLESSKLTLNQRTVDLTAFTQRNTQLFRSLAERDEINYSFAAPEEPVPAFIDEEQFSKVLLNLLSNAFKYTRPKDGIEIGVSVNDDGQSCIRVSDTGTGIPAEALDHIFDRYYRAEQSIVDSERGSGIGLAIVQELVDLHGGSIRVESQPDRGTSFEICLPSPPRGSTLEPVLSGADSTLPPELQFGASAPGDETNDDATRPVSRFASGISDVDITTVLVVDDHEDVRAYIRGHLEERFRVIEAADGAAALELAIENIPDLILSDVMMPVMDGYKLCEAVKSDPRLDFIPVILLTARSGPDEAVEGLRFGADDYVVKPFDPEELLARVTGLILSRRKLISRFNAESPSIHPQQEEFTAADQVWVDKVRSVIEAHLDDASYSVQDLASDLAMDRSSLYRRLQQVLGESPSALMRRFRLERAALMLSAGAGTVTQIAYTTGFASISYFSRSFRQQFGESPTTYAPQQQSAP